MENLFTYGTLMCAQIMEAVSGCRLPRTPAKLGGYRRRGVTGQWYPAIVPRAGECVEGVVYRNVPPPAWRSVDTYEGQMYRRERVKVRSLDGESLVAWTYVFRPEYRRYLSRSDWSYPAFLRNAKAAYLETLRR